MRRSWGFVLALLGTVCCILAGVLAAVNWIGTDDALYYRLQTRENVLDTAGISGEDLAALDAALADCLKGNPNAFSAGTDDGSATGPLKVEVFGQLQPAFNERELTHMEDCRQLFVLLRQVRDALLIAGPLMLLLGALLCWNRKRVRLAAWIAPLVLLIPLGAFAAWAAMDFNSAFNFFHRLLFTNDLWLLDPHTDLLIRICPAGMFMNMGAQIGLLGLIAALSVPAAIGILTSKEEERE